MLGKDVFSLSLTLLLATHLLLVNVASGGPIVAAWLDWRGWRGDEEAAHAAVWLARASLFGLFAGAFLGLLVGWLKWSPEYQALWRGPLRYKLHWAGIEFVFSLALLLVWWLWLPGRAGGRRWGVLTRGVLAVLAATNLLYHFPLLFSVAARLQRDGFASSDRINGAAFRHLMLGGESLALAVHVSFASIAVAGITLLLFALREPSAQEKLARWGAWWALVASVLQLPVGLWTLITLPAGIQSRILGENAASLLLFATAIAAALWLISDLVHIAFGETRRPQLLRAIAALVLTVTLMTAMQQT